ncbi:very short patch repair endonuclease [Parapusillimonas sp. JC17]|uniref:very short patch repair endonuclease n=1 Tax=Parapusillimonas sp. JC17 TaxID=3445768 RepID=UPI003FA0AE18
MVDVLTEAQRQLNMSRIRGRDTKPEMLIRRGLHARGFRYRLQDRSLPGRPDLVFPRYKTVILVHGCFWHGHDCPMFRLPATRSEFWAEKIVANQRRDTIAHEALLSLGWRVLTIWECCLRGKGRIPINKVLDICVNFLQEGETAKTLSGMR